MRRRATVMVEGNIIHSTYVWNVTNESNIGRILSIDDTFVDMSIIVPLGSSFYSDNLLQL
jgi:hypothetical protein